MEKGYEKELKTSAEIKSRILPFATKVQLNYMNFVLKRAFSFLACFKLCTELLNNHLRFKERTPAFFVILIIIIIFIEN